MNTLAKPSDLVDRLQSFEVFQNIDKAALAWLVERSTYKYFPVGEHIFEPGRAVDTMEVIMQGQYVIRFQRGSELQELGLGEAGNITGVLPFSRMKEAKAFGTVLEDVYLLELHKDCFTEMVNTSYELTQALVGVMTSRVRDFTQQRVQNEKLMALGKLSAGLAHELNNPASAIVRSSEELYNRIHTTPEKFKSVMTIRVTPEETDQINEILFSKIELAKSLDLSVLEREERLDELLDWLEDQGIENAEDIADTFVDYGMREEDLEQIDNIIEDKDSEAIMWWLESTMSLERLVEEIRESGTRIAKLISSIKSYSHMDRGVTREAIDVHQGIKNTIIMLKHKFKHKQITIEKDLEEDLPPVLAYTGELNQVWTNIIVNAIDAMNPAGQLKIKTYRDREFVRVDITDNGVGIPEENIHNIFDPFFTTKPIGEGTGLGLEIVKRIVHRSKGDIKVASKPGETTFFLCFPAALKN